MKRIYLLSYNQTSIGVKVIVDAFLAFLQERVEVVLAHSIAELNSNDIVIPYGPKETYDALKLGANVPISLMVDYHTLSLKNRTIFLIKNGYFFSKNLLKSFLSYIYYYFKEIYIYTHCSSFMFVSQHDINQVKKRFPNNHYYCVPNGVRIPTNYVKSTSRDGIAFGILSGWTEGTFLEAKWFIDKFWPKMVEHDSKIKLIICGKYATPSMIDYFNKQKSVEFIGEVDDLASFFDRIDVYVATKPIGCGILNKVLDAMAYNTLVIGISQSFTGFSYMKDSFIVCDALEDYLNFLDSYNLNRGQFDIIIKNANKNIREYNNWENNYKVFIKELVDNKTLTID